MSTKITKRREALDEYVKNAIALRDLKAVQDRLAAVILGEPTQDETQAGWRRFAKERLAEHKTKRKIRKQQEGTAIGSIEAFFIQQGRASAEKIRQAFPHVKRNTLYTCITKLQQRKRITRVGPGVYEVRREEAA